MMKTGGENMQPYLKKWHSETVFDKLELLVPMHDPDEDEYSDKWVITEELDAPSG